MTKEIDHKFVQSATVKELTDDHAVLELQDGQLIKWPKKLLPESLSVSDTVRVLVHDKPTEEQERKALAKALLDEVMHG